MHFNLQSSQQFIGWMLLLYTVTGILWFLIPIPKELLNLGLIIHCVHAYCIGYYPLTLKSNESILSFGYLDNKIWYLRKRDQSTLQAILQSGSLCTVYFSILHFKVINSKERKTIFILPDSLDSKSGKQLRRLLLWEL